MSLTMSMRWVLGDFLVGFAEDGTKIASVCLAWTTHDDLVPVRSKYPLRSGANLLILCSFGVGAEKANGKACQRT